MKDKDIIFLGTERWLQETSGLVELLGSDVKIYDTALHRTAVLLWKNYRYIEHRLSEKARMVFSLKETVILYDLTNTYFEASKNGSSIAKHGKSKERRSDCPLVRLSLTIDEDGFPKQSKVWGKVTSQSPKLWKTFWMDYQWINCFPMKKLLSLMPE